MRYGAWDTNLLKTAITMRYSHVTDRYIRLITRVSVRYGEIFHEPKASEISRHISQLTSVIIIGTPLGSFSH